MALKNERIIYLAKNFEAGLADVTANIRKDGVSVATGVALSDIGNGRYELLLTPAIITGYGGEGYYDFYINSASKSAPAVAARWILENNETDLENHLDIIEGKIDTIDTVADAIYVDTQSIKTTVENSNSILNDPSIGNANLKALIDLVQNGVTNISNVTRFSAPIPKQLIKNEAGGGNKVYRIPIYLYDTNGNMEDPDADQIQVQITDEAGNVRDSYLTGFTAQPYYATKDAAGQYRFDLTIPDTAGLEQLNFKFTYDENTVTLVQGATTEVVLEVQQSGFALETTAQEILTDTADIQPKVVTILAAIQDAGFGLQALKNLLDVIDANTDGVEAELANATYGLAALRTQLDLKASQSSVNILQADVTSAKGTGFDTNTDSLKAISDRISTGGYAV